VRLLCNTGLKPRVIESQYFELLIIMEFKTFKQFYWKSAIWRLGLPWGFITGILFAIVRDKDVLNYFLSWPTLLLLLVFMIGGCFYALTVGRSLWKRAKAAENPK
jgi:hypothetical protein